MHSGPYAATVAPQAIASVLGTGKPNVKMPIINVYRPWGWEDICEN